MVCDLRGSSAERRSRKFRNAIDSLLAVTVPSITVAVPTWICRARRACRNPERADLLWTPEIEANIERWQQTGNFPFPIFTSILRQLLNSSLLRTFASFTMLHPSQVNWEVTMPVTSLFGLAKSHCELENNPKKDPHG